MSKHSSVIIHFWILTYIFLFSPSKKGGSFEPPFLELLPLVSLNRLEKNTMSFKDMLNASAIQAENKRLKEENIKLKKKLVL